MTWHWRWVTKQIKELYREGGDTRMLGNERSMDSTNRANQQASSGFGIQAASAQLCSESRIEVWSGGGDSHRMGWLCFQEKLWPQSSQHEDSAWWRQDLNEESLMFPWPRHSWERPGATCAHTDISHTRSSFLLIGFHTRHPPLPGRPSELNWPWRAGNEN